MSRLKLDAETKAKLKRDGWARIVLPMLPGYCTVLGYQCNEQSALWRQLDWSHAWIDTSYIFGSDSIQPGYAWEYLHVRAWLSPGDEAEYRVRCIYDIGSFIGGKKRGYEVKRVELARDTGNEEWLWVITIERLKEAA